MKRIGIVCVKIEPMLCSNFFLLYFLKIFSYKGPDQYILRPLLG